MDLIKKYEMIPSEMQLMNTDQGWARADVVAFSQVSKGNV